jgi:hypothetical protein
MNLAQQTEFPLPMFYIPLSQKLELFDVIRHEHLSGGAVLRYSTEHRRYDSAILRLRELTENSLHLYVYCFVNAFARPEK